MTVNLMFNTTLTNQKQFFDWIVVGLNNRDECRQRGNGDLQYLIDIPVNTEPCATKIIRPGLIENVIRIQQHPLLIVEGDEVITVRCDYNFPDIVLPPPVLRNAFPFTSGGGIQNQEGLLASTIGSPNSRLNAVNSSGQKPTLSKASSGTFFGPTFIIALLAILSALLLLICCCICFAYTRHKKRTMAEKQGDENSQRNAAVQLVSPRRLGNGRSMSHRSADSPTDNKMNVGGYLWWTGKLPVTRSHPALFDRSDDLTASPSSNPEHLSISTGYPGGSTTPTTGSGSSPGGGHSDGVTAAAAVAQDQRHPTPVAITEHPNDDLPGHLVTVQSLSSSENQKNNGYEAALHPRSFIQAAGVPQVFTHKGRRHHADIFNHSIDEENSGTISHDLKLRDPCQFNRILDEISNYRNQCLLSQIDIDKLTILIRKNPKIRQIMFEAETFNDLSVLKYLNDCKNLFDERKWDDILKVLVSVLKLAENKEIGNHLGTGNLRYHQNQMVEFSSLMASDIFHGEPNREKNNDSSSDKISSDRSTTEFIEFSGKIRKNDGKKIHRSGSLTAESGVIMFDDNMQMSNHKIENSRRMADLNIYMGYLSENDLTIDNNHVHERLRNNEYLDGDYYANHVSEKSRFRGLSFKAL